MGLVCVPTGPRSCRVHRMLDASLKLPSEEHYNSHEGKKQKVWNHLKKVYDFMAFVK